MKAMLDQIEYRLLKDSTLEIDALLASTVYGTKGGLLIQHLDTAKKIPLLQSPDFHTLWEEEKLLAVAVYCQRKVTLGASEVNAYYIRYFSVNPSHQNRGLGALLTEKAVSYYRSTLKEPTVFYAYIEGDNFKSQAVSAHFQPKVIGAFKPILISRFFPKKFDVVHLEPNEFVAEFKLQNRKMAFSHHIERGEHFIQIGLEKEGRIVAAVQYQRVHWKIHQYPSYHFLMAHVLNKIPLLNRLAEGLTLNFIAVEQFWFEDAESLLKLIDHAMYVSQTNKAMLYMDPSDPNYSLIQKTDQLGFLAKIQKSPTIHIQAFFHLMDPNELSDIVSLTKFISAFDVT